MSSPQQLLRDWCAQAIAVDAAGPRQIRGKFWMVQSHEIQPKGQEDRFGRPRVASPARSVHTTYESAVASAQALARMNPHDAFFVMEAVEMITLDKVTFKSEVLK